MFCLSHESQDSGQVVGCYGRYLPPTTVDSLIAPSVLDCGLERFPVISLLVIASSRGGNRWYRFRGDLLFRYRSLPSFEQMEDLEVLICTVDR